MTDREAILKEITNHIGTACQLMSTHGVDKIKMDFEIIDGSEFNVIIVETKKKGINP